MDTDETYEGHDGPYPVAGTAPTAQTQHNLAAGSSQSIEFVVDELYKLSDAGSGAELGLVQWHGKLRAVAWCSPSLSDRTRAAHNPRETCMTRGATNTMRAMTAARGLKARRRCGTFTLSLRCGACGCTTSTSRERRRTWRTDHARFGSDKSRISRAATERPTNDTNMSYFALNTHAVEDVRYGPGARNRFRIQRRDVRQGEQGVFFATSTLRTKSASPRKRGAPCQKEGGEPSRGRVALVLPDAAEWDRRQQHEGTAASAVTAQADVFANVQVPGGGGEAGLQPNLQRPELDRRAT